MIANDVIKKRHARCAREIQVMDLNRCWPQGKHSQTCAGGVFDAEQHVNAIVINALRRLNIIHVADGHNHIVRGFGALAVFITVFDVLTVIIGIHLKRLTINAGNRSRQQVGRRLRKKISPDKTQFNFFIGGRKLMFKIWLRLVF